MSVLVGGIIGAHVVTGMVAVPSAFLLLCAMLAMVWTGGLGMARFIRHAGPLYAHVAQGLGPVAGLAAAPVVLLSYTAIECCLFGVFGLMMSGSSAGPWWAWALAAWLLVTLLGLGRVTVTTKALVVVLGLELIVAGSVTTFGLADAGDGAGTSALNWVTEVFRHDGVGIVLALAVAGFAGAGTTLAFAEEVASYRVLARASYRSAIVLTLLCGLTAWAVTAVARDKVGVPATEGVGIISAILADLGGVGLPLARTVLITAVLAAALSFHQTAARYLFTLSRDGLAPASLGRVTVRTGAPVGGSLAQSAAALTVIGVFAGARVAAMDMFFTLAAVAALGIMTVLAVNGWAAYVYLSRCRQRGWDVTATRLRLLPALGGSGMAGVVMVTVDNLHAMTGAANGSWQLWSLPMVVAGTALGGVIWGVLVTLNRPEAAVRIGRGETEPLAVLDYYLLPSGGRL